MTISHRRAFKVPTINIAAYLEDPGSLAAQSVAEQVRSACTTTGFFQISGHGIPRKLQDKAFEATATFFALPLEEKMKVDRTIGSAAGNRGYEMIGTQELEKGKGADAKEGFYISGDVDAAHPQATTYPQLIGPNVWPDPSILPYSKFRDPMMEYHTAVLSLTLKLMSLLAAGLPYGPGVFDYFISDSPLAVLRPLHYPPVAAPKSIGAGAHTDFGAVTLLLQDDNSGLEVYDRVADQWIPVTPDREAYVVNIGDMLDMWTKGEYRSTLHRVVNVSEDRYSLPFFFDGNLDCKLQPFDGSEPAGGVITAGEHMQRKFGETYIKS